MATLLATLVIAWGWSIYNAILRQEAAMYLHSERITEWAHISLTSASVQQALSIRDPASWVSGCCRLGSSLSDGCVSPRMAGRAVASGTVWMAMQHVRFLALFAASSLWWGRDPNSCIAKRWLGSRTGAYAILGGGVASAFILLAGLRSVNLASNGYSHWY